MAPGDIVGQPNERVRYAYFPTTAVVSLYYMTDSGSIAESACVGSDGMVGIALLMGGDSLPSSAVVRNGGHGYRLVRESLVHAFTHCTPFRQVLLRYVCALTSQIGQTAVCYRYHSIEQQLSRWLLSTANHLPPGEMAMTQELVGRLLGVRRESITDAAKALSLGGYIRYRRGHISILDPAGLETRACECYTLIRAEAQRLLAYSA